METLHDRFIKHINFYGEQVLDTPCWEYISTRTGEKVVKKSISFNIGDGKIVPAHLVAFLVFTGGFPKDQVFSLCKTVGCINPAHYTTEFGIANGTEVRVNGDLLRQCPACAEWFPKTEENFYINSQGTYLKCKRCSVAGVTKSRVANWARVLWYEATRRHLPTDGEPLTVEDIVSIYERQGGRCYWSGIPMEPSTISKYPSKPSLDRLDRLRGYTLDNVVLCCLAMNIGRNSSSKQVFEDFMITLQTYGIQTDLWR